MGHRHPFGYSGSTPGPLVGLIDGLVPARTNAFVIDMGRLIRGRAGWAYYRVALALGLDKKDTIVRRRLRQKMEFLTDSGADLLEPAAGELEAYLATNEQTFRRGPRLAFEQVYLGENPDAETITRSLSALQADPVTDPSALGERTLLPARLWCCWAICFRLWL